jgi:hypothetical protein
MGILRASPRHEMDIKLEEQRNIREHGKCAHCRITELRNELEAFKQKVREEECDRLWKDEDARITGFSGFLCQVFGIELRKSKIS